MTKTQMVALAIFDVDKQNKTIDAQHHINDLVNLMIITTQHHMHDSDNG